MYVFTEDSDNETDIEQHQRRVAHVNSIREKARLIWRLTLFHAFVHLPIIIKDSSHQTLSLKHCIFYEQECNRRYMQIEIPLSDALSCQQLSIINIVYNTVITASNSRKIKRGLLPHVNGRSYLQTFCKHRSIKVVALFF